MNRSKRPASQAIGAPFSLSQPAAPKPGEGGRERAGVKESRLNEGHSAIPEGERSDTATRLPNPFLLVTLHSIVEPLVLSQFFSTSQPLEVELGCGDASFLVDLAQRHPEKNFIGVERLLGRITKLDRKGRRAALANLRGVRIESSYFLQYLLPPHSAHAIHVYFPDPWPKKRHHKNRLINERFPALAAAALVPGGKVYLRTDDPPYFAQMTEVFDAAKQFRISETPAELAGLLTDFEKEFSARGIKTLRAAYQTMD